jgi:hypothetical protein
MGNSHNFYENMPIKHVNTNGLNKEQIESIF